VALYLTGIVGPAVAGNLTQFVSHHKLLSLAHEQLAGTVQMINLRPYRICHIIYVLR